MMCKTKSNLSTSSMKSHFNAFLKNLPRLFGSDRNQLDFPFSSNPIVTILRA